MIQGGTIMSFELNNYHRNISAEDLLTDVQNVAKKLNKNTLTGTEYNQSTLSRRFGSWKEVLKLCNLDTNGHNFKCSFSDQDVINDLKRVASLLTTETLTAKEYDTYGLYSSSTLAKRYGSWNKLLKLANMEPTLHRNITDKEMFEELERLWTLLGRQPTTTDMKKGLSIFSLQSYVRRFGGWRNALQAFIAYINANTIQANSLINNNTQIISPVANSSISQTPPHKTNRDVNLRLRFMVMQRDKFKCCACGASPSTDPTVKLHVDHIVPWSKGGETVLENLQTLCDKCNLGKSDVF